MPVGSSARIIAGSVTSARAIGDALLLAARQLARPVVRPVGEPDPLERGERALAPLARRHAGVDERQLDVAPRRQVGEQVELLEHEADEQVAHVGELVLVERCTSWPASRNTPVVGTSRQPRMCISVDLPEPDGP